MSRRSFAAAGLAGALLFGSAGTAGATADAEINRLRGTDRYGTAISIASATPSFANRTVALLANGTSPADAIAASYLSGASMAPVFLTEQHRATPAVIDAMKGLGIEGVILVGGPMALSGQVHVDLENAGFGVDRLQGADRYETARKIAEFLPVEAIGDFGEGRAAFVGRGDNFADALAAGPLSASQGMPILLTESGTLNTHAKAALTNLGIEQVLLLGGTSAVSPAVAAEIEAMGVAVRRVEGLNRQQTAVRLARVAKFELNYPMNRVMVARGDGNDFADALAGASRGGQVFAPLLLTTGVETLGPDTVAFIEEFSSTISVVDVLGGTSAVSEGAAASARAAARS